MDRKVLLDLKCHNILLEALKDISLAQLKETRRHLAYPALGICVLCSWAHLSNSVWELTVVQDFKSYLGSYLLPTVVLECMLRCSQTIAMHIIILPRSVVCEENIILAGNSRYRTE